LGCILLKVLGPAIRLLPLGLSFFLGKLLGEALYHLDLKHKAVAYANLKKVFAARMSPCELSRLTREFYRSFGQSLIEVFLIPVIDKKYIERYITIEGKEKVFAALSKGNGVILAAVHAGSWELANIISSNLGFAFSMFIREQGLPRLNHLLNEYRKNRGCRIITREEGLREVIASLKNNEAIGMTVDQGGNSGILIDFLGQSASMPKGAVKLALKYNTPIIPIFFTRLKGPKIKVLAGEEIPLSRQGLSLEENLRRVISVFEDFILKYPKEYLWTYKIWKLSNKKKILILSDGKAGHLHQSEAVAREAEKILSQRNYQVKVERMEVKFRNKFSNMLFNLCVFLSGRYSCQGCLFCLRSLLALQNYQELSTATADIVISTGSSISGVNFILSRENLSKSIVNMRPSFLRIKRFNLVIAPSHDRLKEKKNVVITDSALNLIDEEYLRKESERLILNQGLNREELYIGALIGGKSKGFNLSPKTINQFTEELKELAKDLNAKILFTTSRRTSSKTAEAVKAGLKDSLDLKLLIIANENNLPGAVGGILGLSSIVILSPESISMISEAVNSKRYVFVFNSTGLGAKHKRFLDYLAKNRYVYTSEISGLGKLIKEVWKNKPKIPELKDRRIVHEALMRVL